MNHLKIWFHFKIQSIGSISILALVKFHRVLSKRLKFLKVSSVLLISADILSLVSLPGRELRSLFKLEIFSSLVRGFAYQLNINYPKRKIPVFKDIVNLSRLRICASYRKYLVNLYCEKYSIRDLLSLLLKATKFSSKQICQILVDLNEIKYIETYILDSLAKDKSLDISIFLDKYQELESFFNEQGLFSLAEKVASRRKQIIDRKLDRSQGIYNDNLYFSAIGHMCLLGSLIMAKESKTIPDCKIHVLYDESRIQNVSFAKLLKKKAVSSGISVECSSQTDSNLHESGLSYLPETGGSYSYINNKFDQIALNYNNKFEKSLFVSTDINSEIINTAESCLRKYFDLSNINLVGVHIRSSQIYSKSLRNSNFKMFNEGFLALFEAGYSLVRLGETISIATCNYNNQLTWRNLDNLTRFEHEAINIYIWFHSKFFIGNLSGGTFPPSLFNVPTLYVDTFPLFHTRFPGRYDKVVPKILVNVSTGTEYSVDEAYEIYLQNPRVQSENILMLLNEGFDVRSLEPSEWRKKFISFESYVRQIKQRNSSQFSIIYLKHLDYLKSTMNF